MLSQHKLGWALKYLLGSNGEAGLRRVLLYRALLGRVLLMSRLVRYVACHNVAPKHYVTLASCHYGACII